MSERPLSRSRSVISRGWVGIGVLAIAGMVTAGSGELAALPLRAPALPATPLVLAQAAPAGDAATGEVKAAPFAELNEVLAAARARLEELSKAAEVAAAATQLRRDLAAARIDNQRLRAELAQVDDRRGQLATAEAKIAELTTAVEAANARAERSEQDLAAMRWRNAQLATSLEHGQVAHEQAEQAAQAATAKIEALSRSVEESATEIGGLRDQLEDSEQRIAIATSSRNDAEARMIEMQETLATADTTARRLEQDLADARIAAGEAAAAGAQSRARINALQADLGAAQAELDRVVAAKAALDVEMADLQAAASSATDAARQNLLAVETRIEELDRALLAVAGPAPGAVAPAAGPPAPVQVAEASDAIGTRTDLPATAAGADRDGSGPAPTTVAAAAPDASPPQASPRDAGASPTLEAVKAASSGGPSSERTFAQLTAALPLEKRLQAQALMADLVATPSDDGVVMTVAGATLFELNSDRIQRSAYDTLAKVAELLEVYDQNDILIRGHTDALGEAAYNDTLSERRADLVKQFFIDNFEIDAGRLATEGRGEQQPIASNATLDGRRANRRVEVIILD